MIKFFAPWCGHCRTLDPIYKKLVQGFPSSKVVIAEVNCDVEKDLCSRFGIRGLPTLNWYEKNADVTNPEKYSGGRDLQSLVKFVSSKTGIRGKIADAGGYVLDLTAVSFDRVTNDATKNVLVDFYAPCT